MLRLAVIVCVHAGGHEGRLKVQVVERESVAMTRFASATFVFVGCWCLGAAAQIPFLDLPSELIMDVNKA